MRTSVLGDIPASLMFQLKSWIATPVTSISSTKKNALLYSHHSPESSKTSLFGIIAEVTLYALQYYSSTMPLDNNSMYSIINTTNSVFMLPPKVGSEGIFLLLFFFRFR